MLADWLSIVRHSFAHLFSVLFTLTLFLIQNNFLLRCPLLHVAASKMSAPQAAPRLNRRHPLQRFDSPSKGFSAALHVSSKLDLFEDMELTLVLGCWIG